jgi:hypothetical protein
LQAYAALQQPYLLETLIDRSAQHARHRMPGMTPSPNTTNLPTTASELQAAKASVWRLLQQLPGPAAAQASAQHVAADATWHVSHPINVLAGRQAVADQFYGPLQAAFRDLERRCDLFFGGDWVNPCLLYTYPSPRDH